MTQFEQFKAKFDEHYEGDIGTFIEDLEYKKDNLPFQAEIKEDLDEVMYDSYGSEDSQLGKIVFLPEYDIHVKFNGTRQSYEGEEWSNNYYEVKLTTKTIQVYE